MTIAKRKGFPHTWEGAVFSLRNDSARQELVKAAYYDDPLDSAVERYWSSIEWSGIKVHIPARELDVLDVGAGRGIASYALARDGHRVTSLEPDPSEIVGSQAIKNMAAKAGLEIRVEEKVSQPLPFADRSFDLIFARAVLHHIEQLELACKDFYRLLRPGGTLIAVREHVISQQQDLDRFLDSHPLHKLYGGEHAYLLTEYTGAITRAGFKLEKVLAPLDSPINYGPATLCSIQHAVAMRLTKRLPVLLPLAGKALRNAQIWKLVMPILRKLDQRPGRLYSFVAHKD